jgi:hypothetical protein
LAAAGAIFDEAPPVRAGTEDGASKRSVRKGGGTVFKRTESDEDSDFD